MNNDQTLYVARYAEGDMEDAEIKAFEQALQGDKSLQKLLDSYRNVHNTLRVELIPDEGKQQLEKTIISLNAQYFKPEAKVVSLKPYIRWLSGVAAVLFIGLLIWAPWKQSLYDSFMPGGHIAVEERGSTTKSDFITGAQAYNKGDLKTAETYLQKANAADPANARIAYYYGLTLIKNQHPVDARTILVPVYEGPSVFRYDAAFAVALSYLGEKNTAVAKEWLEKIPSDATTHVQAQQLLDKLNHVK